MGQALIGASCQSQGGPPFLPFPGADPEGLCPLNSQGYYMRIIRFILGRFILFIDWLTTPRGIKRPTEKQTIIDQQSRNLTLYQYKACPFCVKVRRSLKRLSLSVELRDPKRSESAKEELVAGAGKLKCPCLKIENGEGETQWMFDSKDIIGYLEGRFAEEVTS